MGFVFVGVEDHSLIIHHNLIEINPPTLTNSTTNF